MTEKIWLGGMYLKEEGGYEIILRALTHYKKRLLRIDKSPELKDSAAMFGGILRQAAIKTIPTIDDVTKEIQNSLISPHETNTLSQHIPILEKALTSYETDIQKAQDTGHEYYLSLIGDLSKIKNDLESIKIARLKIKQFN